MSSSGQKIQYHADVKHPNTGGVIATFGDHDTIIKLVPQEVRDALVSWTARRPLLRHKRRAVVKNWKISIVQAIAIITIVPASSVRWFSHSMLLLRADLSLLAIFCVYFFTNNCIIREPTTHRRRRFEISTGVRHPWHHKTWRRYLRFLSLPYSSEKVSINFRSNVSALVHKEPLHQKVKISASVAFPARIAGHTRRLWASLFREWTPQGCSKQTRCCLCRSVRFSAATFRLNAAKISRCYTRRLKQVFPREVKNAKWQQPVVLRFCHCFQRSAKSLQLNWCVRASNPIHFTLRRDLLRYYASAMLSAKTVSDATDNPLFLKLVQHNSLQMNTPTPQVRVFLFQLATDFHLRYWSTRRIFLTFTFF